MCLPTADFRNQMIFPPCWIGQDMYAQSWAHASFPSICTADQDERRAGAYFADHITMVAGTLLFQSRGSVREPSKAEGTTVSLAWPWTMASNGLFLCSWWGHLTYSKTYLGCCFGIGPASLFASASLECMCKHIYIFITRRCFQCCLIQGTLCSEKTASHSSLLGEMQGTKQYIKKQPRVPQSNCS